MITDPRRVSEVLVGLPSVTVLGVDDLPGRAVVVHVEQAGPRPVCVGCGGVPVVKDREVVELVDLPYGGRPSRLHWRKVRWACPDSKCEVMTWTWADPGIGAPRQALTNRAGRWVTAQVGRCGRSVAEVAGELGCAWHTVNNAVIAYGEPLVDDDPDRIGTVTAFGIGRKRCSAGHGPRVDDGRTGRPRLSMWPTASCSTWSKAEPVPGRAPGWPRQPPSWRANIAWATLDLSGPYRAVFDTMLPDAVQIADRSTWSDWPTRNSTSVAGESRTRPSVIGAARSTRCIGPADCSPELTNASTRPAGKRLRIRGLPHVAALIAK